MKHYYLILSLLLLLSFYLRINYWPFYQYFGFYQGDLWYFFNFYGEQIRNNFFYPIEYPVGYVLIQKITMLISVNLLNGFTYENFMIANAFLIIPTGLLFLGSILKLTEVLKTKSPQILFYLVLSPSVFIYSTINYDLFPATLTVLATILALKNHFYLSFVLLGLGGAIKLYPLFLIPLFGIFMLTKKFTIWRSLIASSGSLISFTAINLPYILYNFNFWLFPYTYQSSNPERNDPTTISYYLFHPTGLDNFRPFFLAVFILISWIITWLFHKRGVLGAKNFLLALSLTTFSAVFANHVYVPQYSLWFLPFFALNQLPQLIIWWPFDLLNASTRFFYFQLNTGPELLKSFWNLTVVFYLFIYILLIYHVRKALKNPDLQH